MVASGRAELAGVRQRPGQLPAEVTGFVGRSAQLARIACATLGVTSRVQLAVRAFGGSVPRAR